jgi:hypothetical protein
VTMLNEAHIHGHRSTIPLEAMLTKMRHDGCSGLPAKPELLTGIGASSRPVRRIVLRVRIMTRAPTGKGLCSAKPKLATASRICASAFSVANDRPSCQTGWVHPR